MLEKHFVKLEEQNSKRMKQGDVFSGAFSDVTLLRLFWLFIAV